MPSPSIPRALLLSFAMLVLLHNDARADRVDRLVAQLQRGESGKIRLSAALNLAKIGDSRPSVIRGFLAALTDSGNSSTLRGVAAASLGKLVNLRTSPSLRAQVRSALQRASNDESSFVKRQAAKALAAVEELSGAGKGGVYIDIGPMSAKSGGKQMRAIMRNTIAKTVRRKAPSWTTTWSNKKKPTSSDLRRRKMAAYHIDGALTQLSASASGSSSVITCKVRLLMASYPEKSLFGFPSGGAQVTSSAALGQVQSAKEDCVTAVIEALVGSKIIPILKMRSASR